MTYPLVLMHLTRQGFTARATAEGFGAPVNEFAHTPEFVESPFAPVVAPNVDTLTSSAWLDLSAEPLCLSVPDTAGRYYAMPLYDAWTSIFATIGARTTGTGARDFVLVGQGWRGRLPRHLPVVQSPTSTAWILGHIRSDGPDDHRTVRDLQKGIRLTPLSRWSGLPAPPRGPVEIRPVPAYSPTARLARMDPLEYFGIVARLLVDNPPHRMDRIRIERMSALGVAAGRPLAWSPNDRAVLREMARGMAEGLAQVETTGAALASSSSSWSAPQEVGRRRADPLLRAASAWTGLGAWPRRDGLFFTTRVDGDGRPLTGTEHYVLRFAPGSEPPTQAFWSLTAHDEATVAPAGSPRRHALGDRDALRHEPDGSLALVLRPDPPGEDVSTWLPTPPGPYSLALRLYWPRPVALDGSWSPPPVERLRSASSPPTSTLAAAAVHPGISLAQDDVDGRAAGNALST